MVNCALQASHAHAIKLGSWETTRTRVDWHSGQTIGRVSMVEHPTRPARKNHQQTTAQADFRSPTNPGSSKKPENHAAMVALYSCTATSVGCIRRFHVWAIDEIIVLIG